MRPFLCGWIIGILVLQTQAQLYALPMLSALALAWTLALLIFARRPYGVTGLLFFGALLMGFGYAGERARWRLDHRLPSQLDHHTILLEGTITSLVEASPHQQRLRFAPEHPPIGVPPQLLLNLTPLPSHGPAPTRHPGQRWRWWCRLKRPHSLRNPGGFDSETWAWSEGILAYGQVRDQPSPQRLSDRPIVWPRDFFLGVEEVRDQLRQRLVQTLGTQRWSAVLIALTIGDQSGIAAPDWQLFWATGIGHLVSISGLHITMLAGLISRLVGLIYPGARLRWMSGLIGATGYSLIAGFSLPTQRTLIMIGVVTATRFAQRPLTISNVLLLAIAIALLGDPMAPLTSGFWLSFGAVCWLVYAGSSHTGRPPFWHELTHTQWAATWATVPLGLWLFGQLSWISPLANAWAIPLVSLAVVPLALAGLLPGLGFCLFWSEKIMDWTAQPLIWLVQHGGTPLNFPTPTVDTFFLALLGTGFLLVPGGLAGRWAGSLGLLGLFLSPASKPALGGMRLDVLDVGQGLAMVITTAHHTLIVDSGPGGRWGDSGTRVLIPFLHSQGIDKVDGLVISHGDLDHSGGAASLLTSYPIPWMIAALPPGHPLWRLTPHTQLCVAGLHWIWDDIRFDILYPSAATWRIPTHKTNDRACVLRLSNTHHAVLLPADIEERAERELLDNQTTMKADVLIVPHHGSKTSSTPEFLAAVSPRWSIFSLGDHNRFHHPNPVVWQRYQELPSARWRTDQCGAITVTLAQDHLSLTGYRNDFPHYWETPCPTP